MLEFRPQELRCDTAPPRHLEFVVLPCYAIRRSNSSAKTSGREKWADACESATNTSGCAITRCTNSESFVHDLETPRGYRRTSFSSIELLQPLIGTLSKASMGFLQEARHLHGERPVQSRCLMSGRHFGREDFQSLRVGRSHLLFLRGAESIMTR
jgi:hypothetical protein